MCKECDRAFSARYKISSNRMNDRSWATGLGCLAMCGAALLNGPAKGAYMLFLWENSVRLTRPYRVGD